ncbi:PIG-L deacetylase family protein [Candidatus Leptofilum sp.]|uniref:PIG-L deacetylase family protein n=1 Tax=Candidatus Leptofilum sp. TaxID=3241576 RepID=UPI003B59C840
MRDWYKTIYLSPHLDDAVLSCGGRIFLETAASHPTLIVTLMAGEPAPNLQLSAFVQALHQRWELPQAAVRARRAEDAAACQILGADFLHWDVPDCVYRTDPATGEPCYPTWESIITTQHPADDAVVAQLTQQLTQLPPADEVVVPLTAGNHVDHRLVRQAAERAFGTDRLLYYEDYPYAAERGAVTAVLHPTMQSTQTVLPETAVAAKIKAIWAYASQRSSFFASRQDAEAKIRTYAAQVGGERYWRRVRA